MAQVTIKINGYAYTVGCEDGQEAHLQAMGRAVDAYVDRVRALGKQSGESQILVLASLLMADELHDLGLAREDGRPARPDGTVAASAPEAALAAPIPSGFDQALRDLAERAENIAALLERD